jgi:hypothetical protein
LATLCVAIWAAPIAGALPAGELAERVAGLRSGEQSLAGTLYAEDFDEGREVAALRTVIDALAMIPDGAPRDLTLACYSVGSPQARVDRCNTWTGKILEALSGIDRPGAARIGRISPRFADALQTPEGELTSGRPALQIFVGRTGELNETPPQVFARAGEPVVTERPKDPDPMGYWTPDNARLKLATQGLPLRPLLTPYRYRLKGADRPVPDAISVEFWLTIDPAMEMQSPQTLVALSDAEGVAFSVHLGSDLKTIGIWNGAGGIVWVDGPFERDRPYHVAVRSRPGESWIHIDGETVAGPISTGFGGDAGGVRSERPIVAAMLGAFPTPDGGQSMRFAGRLGKFRYWSSFLADDYPASIMQRTSVEAYHRFAPSLVLSTEIGAGRFTLVEHPVFRRPAQGWWRQVGLNDIRIHNAGAFFAGLEHPSFSPLHQVMRNGVDGASTAAERAAFKQVEGLGLGEIHPQFSHHPLYGIEWHEGIDPRTYRPVDRHGEVLPFGTRLPMRGISGFKVLWDEFGQLAAIHVIDCQLYEAFGEKSQPHFTISLDPGRYEGDQPEAREQCALERGERDRSWTWFGEKEELRGFSYQHAENGGIVNVYFHTTRTTLGPYSRKRLPGGPSTGETPMRHVYLDHGVPYAGFVAAGSEGFIDALALLPYPGAELAGLVLYAENGEALRFYQARPDLYYALGRSRTIAPHGAPTIRVENAGRIYVSGIDPTPDHANHTKPVVFELIEDKSPVTPNDTYNNTFVSLSKAVNLQANYMGYDILEMDPLHLVRTGTQDPVFEQPNGESRDYYDANRIFVPRGLSYVPEFTGRMHKTVHDTTSYAEFKDALSKSVNAGFQSKALPSFSLSNTMSEARESISEEKKMKSIGISRAAFYDLVLDKQDIALSETFRARVGALAVNGDYRGFIDNFGTHYPIAVVYGGMGVLDIEMTEHMRTSLLQRGVDTKTEMTLLIDPDTESGINFGSENQSESSRLFRSITGTQSEDFYWIGGAHVGSTSESWGVGEDGVVPIHVTLRPIDELLSPLFFDDIDITMRVRKRLRSEVTRYLVEGSALLGDLTGPKRQGFLEIRMDRLFCGSPPEDPNQLSWVRRDTASPSRLAESHGAPPEIAQIYPMLHFEGFDAFGRQLINFAAELDDDDEHHEAFTATCNVRHDILPSSPFLQTTKTGRFAIDVDQLLGGAFIRIVDNRDSEHRVLHPPVTFEKKDQVIDAIEVGATLGLKYLWDEYVGDGSLTADGLDPDRVKPPPAPDARPFPAFAYTLFCETPGASPCPTVTRESIVARTGIWQNRRVVLPGNGPNCEDCKTHVLEYSVRYIQ